LNTGQREKRTVSNGSITKTGTSGDPIVGTLPDAKSPVKQPRPNQSSFKWLFRSRLSGNPTRRFPVGY
jgi:hypothetical protein